MASNGDRTPVIVGIGLSDYPVVPELNGVQHHVLAAQRAIADAGIEKSEIDGYVSAGGGGGMMVDDAVTMAEYLRIDHRYIDGTMTGGSSFEFHVQHLAAAIKDGACDTALVTYGSDQLSKMGRSLGTGGMHRGVQTVAGPMGYEAPYGNSLVGSYAMHKNPITVDDVLSSRMIADPLHLLDCCVITDGGGAFIMTTAERAKDLAQPPVYVLGSSGAQTHWNVCQQTDFTSSAAALAGPKAFAQAGVTHDDVDLLMFYDSFTITCLVLLESLGFVPKGEGGPFVADGHLKKGGKWPLNTDGGGLSSNHPGMRGIFLIIESVRQLRGQGGDAQVPDCEVALAAGSGGWLSCIGVNIFGKEHP